MGIKRVIALSVVLLLPAGAAYAQEQISEIPEPLRYTRVYADSTGASHFADEEMTLALVDSMPPTSVSASIAATSLTFFCFPAGAFVDWHSPPRQQFYFIVSGELELEVVDGEVRQFGPGSALLGEATEGKGVRARWMGSERACVMVMPLGAQ